MTSHPARLDGGPQRWQRLLEHDRPRSLCLMADLLTSWRRRNSSTISNWELT